MRGFNVKAGKKGDVRITFSRGNLTVEQWVSVAHARRLADAVHDACDKTENKQQKEQQ